MNADRSVPSSVVLAVDLSWSTPTLTPAARMALALARRRSAKRRGSALSAAMEQLKLYTLGYPVAKPDLSKLFR